VFLSKEKQGQARAQVRTASTQKRTRRGSPRTEEGLAIVTMLHETQPAYLPLDMRVLLSFKGVVHAHQTAEIGI
jgi:hypothetical protein